MISKSLLVVPGGPAGGARRRFPLPLAEYGI